MFNFTKNVTLAVVFLSHLIVVRINYLISSYLDKFLSTSNTPPNKFLGIDHNDIRQEGGGVLSHSDFFCISGQSLLVFFLTMGMMKGQTYLLLE